MDQKTEPTDGLTAGYIMHELGSDVRGALLEAPPTDEVTMVEHSVSGGYAGAIQYTLLYWLFGYFASKFVMIVMFAISIMLMTGKSYVDIARMIRHRGGRLFSLLRAKLIARRPAAAPVGAGAAPRAANGRGNPVVLDQDLDDEDDDYGQQPRSRGRRARFFSWFSDSPEPEAELQEGRDSEWLMDEERMSESSQARRQPQWMDGDEDEEEHDWQGYHDSPNASLPDQPDDDVLPWREEYPHNAESQSTDENPESPPYEPFPVEEDEYVPDEADDYELPAAADSSPAMEQSEALSQPAPAAAAASRVPSEKPYQLPPLSLLAKPGASGRAGDMSDANDSRRKLEATLESFGVRAKVLDVVRGPAVTRYEVQPATGVKVSRIVGLTDDIALALAAKDIRMEAPIPGKSAIGIEVPNNEVSVVTMREVMETPSFLNAPSRLSISFGRDISGQPIVGNLAKMPHLLVAGATGSGKSVCINGIITSILYKARPDEVKFLMIDPKMVELNMYNGIPHLLAPVVTDPRRASLALKKIVVEMEKRYEMFSKSGTRNIEGYNNLMADNPAAVLPFIVVIVDELADLMMVAANDVEDAICRLAQMARAAGIHLIIATQRPSVDVITGVIKANIPSRIAFGVSSQVDSRTILDMVGAEKLLGRGDMLFLPVGMSKPIRVQGAFLSDGEVEAVVSFSREQGEAEYKEDLVPEIDDSAQEVDEMQDELFDQAVRIVLEAKQASVSLLQRRMRIGYTRAARLIDQMEAKHIIGPYEGSKPREVLLTLDQYDAGKISS
ncbi:DNA translocase FtsK [Paenibacillus oenotherae]|uniref:DNA translocase FtsK n=2 Tax=Paenibacillus oenotherae TaxID=1435645 RepID=A0ABS7D082_9BACL|nr:DNA translocase FtsK [Paenibacillus oenotherae]